MTADPLLELTDGVLLESGIYPSLPQRQRRVWNDASNVLFVDKGVEKARGIEFLGTTAEAITALTQAFVGGNKRAYMGTATKLYNYESPTVNQIGSGYAGTRWSMIAWGTWLIATNNVDHIQVWKNTGTAADLGGAVSAGLTKARIVRKLAERPIFFTGQRATWPRATDIEYFTTPDPTGNAGNFDIRDLDSDIIAVEAFGEQLAYYTRNQMGFVTFIGGNAVYGFKNRLDGIGAIGLNSVIPVGAYHYGMSATGIWKTDGSGYEYIDPPAINRFLVEHFNDKSRGDEVVGVHVVDRDLVAWFFPGVGDEIHGVAMNYGANQGLGAWTHLHFQVTAACKQDVFDNPLAATGINFGLLDEGNDLNSATMPSSLVSGAFDANAPQRFKWWEMVQLNLEEIEGTVEVSFMLHRFETYGDDPGDETLPWTTAARENWIQRESVYLTMQLRTTDPDCHWRLGGVSVFGALAGWCQ